MAGDFEGEYGDRRQEVVFIGVGMDEVREKHTCRRLPLPFRVFPLLPYNGSQQAAITAALDGCLLGPDEMVKYKEHFVKPKVAPAAPD